jgi:hypothetical protein
MGLPTAVAMVVCDAATCEVSEQIPSPTKSTVPVGFTTQTVGVADVTDFGPGLLATMSGVNDPPTCPM